MSERIVHCNQETEACGPCPLRDLSAEDRQDAADLTDRMINASLIHGTFNMIDVIVRVENNLSETGREALEYPVIGAIARTMGGLCRPE